METYSFGLAYSPNDKGWYAEIWETATGKEVYQTDAVHKRQSAVDAAKRWIEKKTRKTTNPPA